MSNSSDPMDCSLPGSSIHGIFQARVLEWGAIAFSTMEYYLAIKRNTFESVLTRWINLESIMQSEVSQKEKDKYHILTHIYESRKMLLKNLFIGQQWRNRNKE